MFSISRRVLPALQLTRMALVFTAIADSSTALLLWARGAVGPGQSLQSYIGFLDIHHIGAVVLISIGLYGFGMSLNDIIDRRRDRQIASHRPLPSGRMSIITAHIICGLLISAALLGGLYLMRTQRDGDLSLLLVIWTAILISFYDAAGKYLVAPGLLSLGLIRFFHAIIAAPRLPLLWHPLLLLNHVAILSTVAYVWEEKRPALKRIHWWAVLGGLALVDTSLIGLIFFRRHAWDGTAEAMGIGPELWPVAGAILAFIALAWTIRHRNPESRAAGQALMLAGLLWLIVYDAAFAAGYVSLTAGISLLILAPMAWVAMRIMRWWTRLIALAEKPGFRRAPLP